MSNHEVYVSQELATLLKKAGFDWECRKIYYCYHEDGDKWELDDNYMNHQRILKLDSCLLAPTLSVAQRWMREVMGINVEVMYLFNPCNYYFARACHFSDNSILRIDGCSSKIYELALEAGIVSALNEELNFKNAKKETD